MAELSTLQLQRCRACGCTQRVAECQKKVTLKLKLKPDDSNWVTAFENVLSFFTDHVTNADELFTAILASQNLEVTINNQKGLITNIEYFV